MIQCEYGPDFVTYIGAGAVAGFHFPLFFFQISYRKTIVLSMKKFAMTLPYREKQYSNNSFP